MTRKGDGRSTIHLNPFFSQFVGPIQTVIETREQECISKKEAERQNAICISKIRVDLYRFLETIYRFESSFT